MDDYKKALEGRTIKRVEPAPDKGTLMLRLEDGALFVVETGCIPGEYFSFLQCALIERER